MKINGMSLVLVISITLVCPIAEALTPKASPPNYFQRINNTNSFSILSPGARILVRSCGIANTQGLNQFWNPTETQVGIVDNKIDLTLDKDMLLTDKYVRVYLGLSDVVENKHIYAFIYPVTYFEKMTKEFGTDLSICTKLKTIVDFNLDDLKIRFTKADVSNAIERKAAKNPN